MNVKFKVWNSADTEMEYEGFYLDQTDGTLFCLDHKDRPCEIEHVEVLLSTGAKDQQKNEIFNKDILESSMHGIGVVFFDKDFLAWKVRGKGWTMMLSQCIKDGALVIGNELSDPKKLKV